VARARRREQVGGKESEGGEVAQIRGYGGRGGGEVGQCRVGVCGSREGEQSGEGERREGCRDALEEQVSGRC